MSKKSVVIMPETQRVLETMGEQIKMARLRRNLATELVAERAGISRATLWSVEKGSPTVSIGTYAAVLHALGGMDMDFENVAKDDELGKKLQDLNLLSGKRAKRANFHGEQRKDSGIRELESIGSGQDRNLTC